MHNNIEVIPVTGNSQVLDILRDSSTPPPSMAHFRGLDIGGLETVVKPGMEE